MTDNVIFMSIIVMMGIAIFLLIISKKHHGSIIVMQAENGKKIFSLELDEDPEKLENMKSVTFKVVKLDDIAD